MGAFVVDPAQIDVLLSVTINGPADTGPEADWLPPCIGKLLGEREDEAISATNAGLIGRVLLEESVASVSFRYGGNRLALHPG